MRLSYGLGIMAALITGGVAMYYTTPRSVVTAPDLVELKEGVNERRAAIGAWPFTGTAETGWSFTVFSTQTAVFAHADLSNVMQQCYDLSWSFVQSNDYTNIHYWNPTSLFTAVGVGPADGTQTLFTVGIDTNGAPIYSNTPIATIFTGTLWECYRLLAAMTTTARNATWLGGQVVSWGTNQNDRNRMWVADTNAVTNTIVANDEFALSPPTWWTNVTLYFKHVVGEDYGAPAVLETHRVSYNSTNELDAGSVFQSGEYITFRTVRQDYPWPGPDGRLRAMRQRISGTSWEYTPDAKILETPHADRYFQTAGVWFARFPSGVVADVKFVWRSSAFWEHASIVSVYTNFWTNYGTSVSIIVFDGINTGYHALAEITNQSYLMADYFSGWTSEVAHSYWRSPAYNSGVDEIQFTEDPPPVLQGTAIMARTNPAIINWTFTRCTN